jgi:uncharacterized protein (TIGR02145 family)
MKNVFRLSGVILLILSIFLIHSCKKKEEVPVITTTAVSAITQTTATSGGNVTSDGGATVTARGVCWSTTTGPTTVLSTKTTDNTGTGVFASSITALTAGTVYYVKAYATNSAGTSYGNEISFTTTASTVPVLTTTAASSITQTTATSGGNITSDGGATVTARGVCWSTVTNPTTNNRKTIDGTGTGTFVSTLTGLTGDSTYYVRAYATNSAGTQYGNQVSFTTNPLLPTLTTVAISLITGTTCTSGGNISSDGGAAVTARGVCWSTTSGPTTALSTKTTDATGTGVFTSSITGLTANTKYYLKAYATNSVGTSYGSELTFTTLGQVPTVTTLTASNINTTSATLNGSVNANYLSTTVTFEYGTTTSYGNIVTATQSPVTGNTNTNVSAGITGLVAGSTYHFRVKAENSLGTINGSDLTFIVLGQVPTVTSLVATNITTITAQINGLVNANYLSTTITFEYGTTTSYGNIVTASQSPITGTTSTNVNANISGLIAGSTYHFRIKAVNSVGISYGNDLSFTTVPSTITDIDGNIYNVITIGSQVWMASSLRTTKYNNGNLIGTTSPATLDVSGETAPEYQWSYGGNEINAATYGRLYTWYAINDSRNVCPTGWHVPTNDEWVVLQNALGGSQVAGGKMKEAGLSHWLSPNEGADNSSGFNGLPSGYRSDAGVFYLIGQRFQLWSISVYSTDYAHDYELGYDNTGFIWGGWLPKKWGLSVRCLRDY